MMRLGSAARVLQTNSWGAGRAATQLTQAKGFDGAYVLLIRGERRDQAGMGCRQVHQSFGAVCRPGTAPAAVQCR